MSDFFIRAQKWSKNEEKISKSFPEILFLKIYLRIINVLLPAQNEAKIEFESISIVSLVFHTFRTWDYLIPNIEFRILLKMYLN